MSDVAVILVETGVQGPPALKPIAVWATGQIYNKSPYASFVQIAGSSYECLVSHVSGVFADDLAAGNWGLVAEKGDTGAQGPQGGQGIQGAKGDTGATGAKGDKGDPGAQGVPGAVATAASDAEAIAGADTEKYTPPHGLKAALDARIPANDASQLVNLPHNSRPKLLRFMKQLYAGVITTGSAPNDPSRPSTNLVRVGVFGDSVGYSKPQFVLQRLRYSLGYGVPSVSQFFNNAGASGGASAAGNVNDGSYWINGGWFVCPAGGVVEWLMNGGRPVCSQIKLYYIKEPGAGTFKVQTNSGSGYADEAGYTSVDASNASVTAGVITLNYGSLAGRSIKVVGLTGTVRFVSAASLDLINGGVAEFHFDTGGLPLATANLTPAAIRSVIFNDLALDLAFMEFKDGNEWPVSFPTWMDWYRANITTPTDWVLIGTSPEAIELTTGSENKNNNAVMKAYADAHGYPYFDGYGVFGDYPTLVTYGWSGDGTHLPGDANAYAAGLLWSFLGFDDLLLTASGRPWVLMTGQRGLISYNPTGSGGLRWQGDPSNAYGMIDEYFDGFERIVKGGRSYSFRDASGNPSINIGTGQNRGSVQASILSLVPLASLISTQTTSGPCLRPLGSADTSGMYISGLSPGSGSTVAPFLASKFLVGATTGPFLSSGVGSPEGAVTAPIGSIYMRSDGAAGTAHYVKESGSGNTGWVAK